MDDVSTKRLVLAVGLIVLAIFAVRVADPEFLEDHPKIDFTETPNEIARDSLANLSAWDYTYVETTSRWNASKREWMNRSLFKFKLDNTGERMTGWLKLEEDSNITFWEFVDEDEVDLERRWEVRSYFTSAGTWGFDGQWRFASNSLTFNSATENLAPTNWDLTECDWTAIRNTYTLVLECNERRKVANVTHTSLNEVDNKSYVRLYIDKDEGHLSKMVLKRLSLDYLSKLQDNRNVGGRNESKESNSSIEKTYMYRIHEFRGFGNTTVQKPPGVPPFSFEGLVMDIIQG